MSPERMITTWLVAAVGVLLAGWYLIERILWR